MIARTALERIQMTLQYLNMVLGVSVVLSGSEEIKTLETQAGLVVGDS